MGTVLITIILTSVFWLSLGVIIDQVLLRRASEEIGEHELPGNHRAG